MSDKIPTSSRLDSLSRRSTPVVKPSLKFKPKTVARRTKEERDADAPTATETKRTPHAIRGNAARGRGSARGGRGGRALAGTHLVQAGPLASGNVLNETRQNMSRSATHSPTPEFLSKLMKREGDGSTREGSASLDSDDDEGNLTKINMNKEYKFAPEDSELFPVRAPRADHIDTEVKIKPETQEVPSRSTTPESVLDGMNDETLPTSVKDEPLDKGLNDILKEKDDQLHKKLNQLELNTSYIPPDALDDAGHSEKRLNDHKDIVKQILEIDNKDDKYMFFQLPRVLPEFKKPQEDSAIEEEHGEPKLKTENGQTRQSEPQQESLEGKIGTLRVHKSGKVTMKIGNVVMDVTRGSKTTFLQEVVMLDRGEDKASYLMGHVQDKIVVTPRFD